jgi:hypothetical protein
MRRFLGRIDGRIARSILFARCHHSLIGRSTRFTSARQRRPGRRASSNGLVSHRTSGWRSSASRSSGRIALSTSPPSRTTAQGRSHGPNAVRAGEHGRFSAPAHAREHRERLPRRARGGPDSGPYHSSTDPVSLCGLGSLAIPAPSDRLYRLIPVASSRRKRSALL